MKKRFFALIMILCLTIIFKLPCYASGTEEFLYGKIIRTVLSDMDWTEDELLIKISDINGKETIYTCAQPLKVNGAIYSDLGSLENMLLPDLFVRFVVEDEVITMIDFDGSAISYNNLAYNVASKTFASLDESTSLLPVYYSYQNEFVPAYLDENHLYSIELYDYAINIVQMMAKDKPETIENIEITSSMNSDYTQTIEASCYTTSENSILYAQLYDDKMTFIEEKSADIDADIEFNNLPNIDAGYIIRFWMEDESEVVVSNVYEKQYQTEKVEVLYGKITAIGDTNIWVDELYIQIDINGIKTTYICTRQTKVNGVRYSDLEELGESIPQNSFVRFVVEDGVITMLNIDKPYYRIKSITIKDTSKNPLPTITGSSLYATVSIKNVSANKDALLMLVLCSDTDDFKGVQYARIEDKPVGSDFELDVLIDNSSGDVAKLKAFCWESFSSMIPMSNSASYPTE